MVSFDLSTKKEKAQLSVMKFQQIAGLRTSAGISNFPLSKLYTGIGMSW